MAIDERFFYKTLSNKFKDSFKLTTSSSRLLFKTNVVDDNDIYEEKYRIQNNTLYRDSGLYILNKNDTQPVVKTYIENLSTSSLIVNDGMNLSYIYAEKVEKGSDSELTAEYDETSISNNYLFTKLMEDNSLSINNTRYNKENASLLYSLQILSGNLTSDSSLCSAFNDVSQSSVLNDAIPHIKNFNLVSGLLFKGVGVTDGSDWADDNFNIKGQVYIDNTVNTGDDFLVQNPENKTIIEFIKDKTKLIYNLETGKYSLEVNPGQLDETINTDTKFFFDPKGYYPIFCETTGNPGFEIIKNSPDYNGKDIVKIYCNELIEGWTTGA